MKYIIKVSPEITIKSKVVRQKAIRLLGENIKIHLDKYEGFFKISVLWDKIGIDFLDLGDCFLEIESVLSKIPGILYFYQVLEYDFKDFEDILEKVKESYVGKIEDKSFVVRVKRAGIHDFKSTDLESYLGGELLDLAKNSKVNLHNPDFTISIEIKDSKIYLVQKKINAIGGYPVGFQNKVLSLISGGFDSGVSTYLAQKRGCKVDFLFFNLGGTAHEIGVKQVAHYLWDNFSKSYNARFITIPFEDIITELLTKTNHRFRAILLKRLMLKVASRFASRDHYALVKGDSLGQVSSQTLKNMNIIEKASDILVLRPLIFSDKQEIVNISKEIGTYSFACNMPEYCGVISLKPSTGAKEEDVISEEAKIDSLLLEKVYKNKKIEKIKDILTLSLDDNLKEEIEIKNLPGKGEIIIDLREEEKIKKDPLTIKDVEILDIPFFEVNSIFKTLDQKKTYLFYCDKGLLSKLHALYLKEKGFENIKLFRMK